MSISEFKDLGESVAQQKAVLDEWVQPSALGAIDGMSETDICAYMAAGALLRDVMVENVAVLDSELALGRAELIRRGSARS